VRLLLVISSLGPGGAERVLSTLASSWASRGYQVHLVTLEGAEAGSHYPLDPAVIRHGESLMAPASGWWNGIQNNLRRVVRLRERIRNIRPDVVLSFMDATSLLVLLAGIGLNAPIVVSERTDPMTSTLGRARRLLRRVLYPRAAMLVVQTSRARQYFAWMPDAHVRIIPNGVRIPDEVEDPIGGLRFVAMGRLSREKGFDVLLQAFERLHRRHPDVHLVILGEGRDRPSLEQLRETLGLTEVVKMAGVVENPYAVMAGALGFVLSSRREGFPNALLEAMALGLPVIATDCPCGPAEILEAGEDGLLIPPESVSALADAMIRLVEEESLRIRLGRQARKSVERFLPERIQTLWDEALRLPALSRGTDR